MTNPGEEVLAKLRAERGYLLSYHEIFGRLEPELLDAYGDLYRRIALTERFLSGKQRELIHLGLRAAIEARISNQHLQRAIAAGTQPAELAAAVALAGAAASWPAIAYGVGHWQSFLEADAEHLYSVLVDAARGPLETEMADFILLIVHGARKLEVPFVYHLNRLIDSGVPESQIAECVSYLLPPLGNLALLWATDTWLAALRDRRLPPSATFKR